jgi:Family of unknown function (DUF5946)
METDAATVRCFGCGGLVPQMDGPTHRYMLSSPGCWHVYGQVLVRDYTDPALRDVHRLTVDSYAVQHPGQPTPQAIQSVCVHLMSLCLIVERGLATSYATRVMDAATKPKDRYFWLTPPASLGAVTVVDVAEAVPAQYPERVREWAEAAWSAWAEHHPTIRGWLPAAS